MRRLLAPMTRWLDRRIDARIAAAEIRRRDYERFVGEIADDLRDAGTLSDAAVRGSAEVIHAAEPRRDDLIGAGVETSDA